MKRNTFFARFLVTNTTEEAGVGEGYVIEHFFTTRETYILQPIVKDDVDKIETRLETSICKPRHDIVETSNGLLVPFDGALGVEWIKGYLNVFFNVVEDGVNFPTLEGVHVHSVTSDGEGDNYQISSGYSVAAYAIGMIADDGNINISPTLDNTRWVEGSDVIGERRSLFPGALASNKFMNKTAFSHPTYLPEPSVIMEEVECKGVFAMVPGEPVETDGDCCASQNHSNAINAAAILVASNNATTPVLIKKIEDAVSNNFDLPSTLSALQSMRQLGTLSNMTGKVLDNLVRKDINADFNIKNGREVE